MGKIFEPIENTVPAVKRGIHVHQDHQLGSSHVRDRSRTVLKCRSNLAHANDHLPITHFANRPRDNEIVLNQRRRVFWPYGNYFRTGNADREFNKMDTFVVASLRCWQYRRGGQRQTKRAPFTGDQLYRMGLHKLMGTVTYPAQSHTQKIIVKACAGNGTHGLKGEI